MCGNQTFLFSTHQPFNLTHQAPNPLEITGFMMVVLKLNKTAYIYSTKMR